MAKRYDLFNNIIGNTCEKTLKRLKIMKKELKN